MYVINESTKKLLERVGYVAFEPKTQWLIDNKVVNRCEHSIKFFRKTSNFTAKLGDFNLVAIIGESLELENLEFSATYELKLKIHFCYMIVKEAISQAKCVGAKRLIIETKDPMFIEAFLDYGFKMREIEIISNGGTIYRATKEMELKEKRIIEKGGEQ